MKKLNPKCLWLLADAGLAFVMILIDQLSKNAAIEHLKNKSAFVLIKGVFELDYVENRGSAFGMFQNQKVFLLLISILFMVLIAFLLFKTPNTGKYLPIHVVGTMIVAGGIGNMLDRFRLGYVVDFFSFILIHYPVFNVADIYIVVSTITLAVLLIFFYKEEDLRFLGSQKEQK